MNKFWLLFLILTKSFWGFSQRIEEKILIKYTQENGLSSYNIRKIIQDQHGFMWIATQDGLNRFDGRRFVVYRKNEELEKYQLSGVDVRDLIEDTAKHLLWVLPGEGGLSAIDTYTGTIVRRIASSDSTSEDWNMSMVHSNKRIWIGSFNGLKIFNTETNQFETTSLTKKQQDLPQTFETRSVFKDQHENVWACFTGYGVVIFDGKTKEPIAHISPASMNVTDKEGCKFWSVAQIDTNKVLLATSKGLRVVSFNQKYNSIKIDNEPCKSLASLNNTNINFVYRDSYNEIFIVSNEGLYKFTADLNQYVSIREIRKTTESDWIRNIHCVWSDYSRNLWLGCQEGFAMINSSESPFRFFYTDPKTGIKLEHVHSLFATDKYIFVGLRKGLAKINRSSGFTLLDTSHLFHHIFKDPNGFIHAIHSEGMFIVQNNRLVPAFKIYKELLPYSSFAVNSHVYVGDSILVLGTENNSGIIIWNIRSHSAYLVNSFSKPVHLGANIVNSVFLDEKKKIWILSDKSITVIDESFKNSKTLEYIDPASHIPYNIYFDIQEAAGYYWITAYGTGLLKIDPQFRIVKIYNSKSGLSNDGVYKIFKIDESQLLITSNYGISVFNILSEKFSNYYESDGLHSNAFEENSGYMDKGIIYAGGVRGFTEIVPSLLQTNKAPPVVFISDVQMQTSSGKSDSATLLKTSLTIPNNVLQATIYFSGLNYTNPQRTSFAYKIKSHTNEWINLGSQNFVNLIGLPPGTYRFQVKAANENGVWSQPITLDLVFLPKWYQTWWFKVLLVLLFVAIVFGLYKYRIHQINKEQLIRTKLASDLHDDLGSTLNSVKVYANLALLEKGQEKHLIKIKESTQEAITGIRDMIWVLDDKKDTIEDLVNRVNQFAVSLCEANKILYRSQISDEASQHKLSQEEKRNLYMIAKEAINNCIKYAEATELNLFIGLTKGKPEIVITDNGKGFNVDQFSSGNGLKNMKFRSEQINYKTCIQSWPGKGTKIQLYKI